MINSTIYLDHAATSGVRPQSVYEAVDRQIRTVGGAALRGNHRAVGIANQVISQCRQVLARLIHAGDARSIALTGGCTQSLNFAIHGLLRPGMHVVTTAAEHNSMLRPLEFLRQRLPIRLTIVPVNKLGQIDVDRLLNAIEPDTQLVAMTLASNVSGAVNDVGAIGTVLKSTETLLLCDAAQAIGYLPLDVQTLGIDLLAIPGHKGLLGPLGTGALYAHPRVQSMLTSTMQGGTGTSSHSLEMPDEFPQKLEAGNLNVPGFAGLAAGVEHLLQHGLNEPQLQVRTRRLLLGLADFPSIRVHGPVDANSVDHRRGPVISVTIKGWSPHDVAAVLDTEFGIQVRAGLHCAPLIHEAIGSYPLGTVRISLGHFTTATDIDALLSALHKLVNPN